MKQIIVVMIIILTVIIAISYINKVKLHTKAINQCVLMIENMEVLLLYNNLSVFDIFKILSENNTYYLLPFIKAIYDNMNKKSNDYVLSENNILEIKRNNYLNTDDKETIINFLSLLGKSDLNGQITNCKTYKEIFKKKLKEHELYDVRNCKTSGMMILAIGFLIVIIMI